MTPSDAKFVTVPFLGSRNYIQGPSLLQAMASVIPADAAVDFKVKRVIESDRLLLHALTDGNEFETRYAALLTCERAGSRHCWGAEPLQPSGKPLRLPYDEERIWSRAAFSERQACLKAPFDHDFPSLVTSLNKALLLRTVAHPEPGRWVFASIQLDRMRVPQHEVGVEKAHSLRGSTVMRSRLFADNAPVGILDFVWKAN
jgi:hypothetical protein